MNKPMKQTFTIDGKLPGYNELHQQPWYKSRRIKQNAVANKEAIQSIKLQLRLIENQLQREWGGGNNIL